MDTTPPPKKKNKEEKRRVVGVGPVGFEPTNLKRAPKPQKLSDVLVRDPTVRPFRVSQSTEASRTTCSAWRFGSSTHSSSFAWGWLDLLGFPTEAEGNPLPHKAKVPTFGSCFFD